MRIAKARYIPQTTYQENKLTKYIDKMVRTRRVESKKEMERVVDDLQTEGYKIKKRGEYSVKVKSVERGDVPTHGFLFLFTLISVAILFDVIGLPPGAVWIVALGANSTYAAYSWYNAKEIVIKVDQNGNI